MVSCDCSAAKKTSGVQRMFQGAAPDDAVCQAIQDAEIFVDNYGQDYKHNYYDILVRYYACHLLHSWGFAKTVTSTGVGPISESRQVAEYGGKEGADPYITEFRKLLSGENEIITSI
jgi:hypothetical protein